MRRHKIDYGIDLGTTNSAIARCDDGVVRIIKSSRSQKDTTPSCIHINKKLQIVTGDLAFSKLYRTYDINRTFIEFKRTMGLDTLYPLDYPNEYNSDIEKRFNSEELSAEVLKTMRSYVTDDTLKSVVITVPARFERVQCDATIRAAKLAGFEYAELLLEPIAASTAFAVDTKFSDGYWLVYDFGGGTFDVALVCSIDGIMKVVGTAGDTHLGGKDFDNALLEGIVLNKIREDFKISGLLESPQRISFLTSLKSYTETLKMSFSSESINSATLVDDIIELEYDDDNGKGIHLDYEISKKEYEDSIKPFIQRSIDLTLELLNEHKIKREDLKTILMVGGPTFTPLLRKMVKEQISENINVSIDPMTVVAKGAAIYASTRDIPIDNQTRDLTKIQLILNYPSTTVDKEVSIAYEIENFKSEFSKNTIQIIRKDEGYDSGKLPINGSKGILELELLENKHNLFEIYIYDEYGNKVSCEPNNITVFNGGIYAPQVTTHDYGIGIEVIDDEGKAVLVFQKIISKNTNLPTEGRSKFKIKKEVRPGIHEDFIWIPILEGVDGTKLIRNNLAKEYYKYGNNDKISRLIPAGTEVEILMKIDAALKIEVAMFIPLLDETFEFIEGTEDVPDITQKFVGVNIEDIIVGELGEANERIETLLGHSFNTSNYKMDSSNLENLKKEAEEINKLADTIRNDEDKKKHIKDRVNELQKKLDDIDTNTRHLVIGDNITQGLNQANQLQERYGDNETRKELEIITQQYNEFKENKNPKFGKLVLDNLSSFTIKILNERIEFWVNEIFETDKYFNVISWKQGTQSQAKQIIANAKSIISSGPTTDALRSIMIKLWDLMENGKPNSPIDTGALTK
ncbi:MAG: Hsp70 family protein [Ignavibacteria bacterium]